MLKYSNLFIIILLISSGFSVISSNIDDNIKNHEISIYQITPNAIEFDIASYKFNTKNNVIQQNIKPMDNYSYLILTKNNLESSIVASNFIDWKESLGYTIKLINIQDDLIQNQNGFDLAEKIRNFLREYYIIWNIKYLLIIGDYETVPMRYCYPDPLNHRFDIFDYTSGEVPTDYYYADLTFSDSESWDSDGDGFYGEYSEDFPDFFPELYVGRIPINDGLKIIYTLDKIVKFEQDSSSWKKNALNVGAFFYFSNETSSGQSMDGAVLSFHIEKDIMEDWTISHYSEQDGIEKSIYNWSALTEESFINDWRNGKYSIVNWQGHGWTNGVARKVWNYDNGNNIPEGNEISWPRMIYRDSYLDDDFPSIVTAVSCYVGCPEPDPNVIGNLGIDLLTDPTFGSSIGVIASARSPYGSSNWPIDPGGSDQIIYKFNENLIKHREKLGEAFYNSKYHSNFNYGWDHYAEYIDMFTFNLFGDPTLTLEGAIDNKPPEKPQIIGEINGAINKEYTYTIISNEPENDEVSYFVDWGDNSNSGWTIYLQSGEECNVSHIWNSYGNYQIRAKAKDSFGVESDWSIIEVKMPKVNNLKINLLRNIFKIIKNPNFIQTFLLN